jgi:hypothetical protein
MANDWKLLIAAAVARGWEVKRTRKHLILARAGHTQVILPKTSSKPRTLANARAQLRREERRARGDHGQAHDGH